MDIKKVEERFLNPPPGSKAEAAKEFGIDLTLTLKNLSLTPQQRVDNLQKSMRNMFKFQRDAEKWRLENRDRTRTRA